MPISLQEFLSRAQDNVIPDPTGQTRIADIFGSMVGTVDFSKQARNFEVGQSVITSVIISRPQWTFPQVPVTESVVYHHIAISSCNPSANQNWRVSVDYPGMTAFLTVLSVDVDESFPIDFIHSRTAEAVGGAGKAYGYGRPIIVGPRGRLRVARSADNAIAVVGTTLQWVRERIGGPGTNNFVDDAVGAFV